MSADNQLSQQPKLMAPYIHRYFSSSFLTPPLSRIPFPYPPPPLATTAAAPLLSSPSFHPSPE
eukprot:766393-Hanusia_phi.AAC.4